MNWRNNSTIYESGFKTDQSCNGSGYQTIYEGFVCQEASNCDAEITTSEPIAVNEKLPCVEQIKDISI